MNKSKALGVLATAQKGHLSRTTESVAVPFLEGTSLPVTFFATEVDLNLAADAIVTFSTMSASCRAVIQDRLFSAAQKSFKDCSHDFESPQKQLDWEAESTGQFRGAQVPTRAAEIWPLVTFKSIHIERGMTATSARHVVKVCGDCAWDGEHGVSVNFDVDGNLTRVGEG